MLGGQWADTGECEVVKRSKKGKQATPRIVASLGVYSMILSSHLALHALETGAHNVGGGSSRAVSATNTLVFEASSVHDARVRLHLQINEAQD